MPIGETISTARRARGRSVEDVATATRIRPGVLSAIEAEDFTACGGSVYARGHLRSIAGVLGLDAAALVAEFDRRFPAAPAAVALPGLDRTRSARMQRRGPSWTAATAGVLVVVCLLAAVDLVMSPGRPAPSRSAPQLTGAPAGPGGTAAEQRPAPRPSGPAPSAGQDVVTVALRLPVDKSWVSVTGSAGRRLFEGVLPAGSFPVFRDPQLLRLVIGNAGAVDLVVNGRAIGVAGARGSVRRLVFGRAGAGAAGA